MKTTPKPRVTATPPAASTDAQTHYARKLACETDCADVYADLQNGYHDFVLVDTRSADDYARSHIPGAVNVPVASMTERRMETYADDTLFVVYCWGPGCNGSTKAALQLARMGYAVKEMIGGIEYWEDRERYPVVRRGEEERSIASRVESAAS